MKKKCYVLIVSETFPKCHPRAGDHTGFCDKIFRKKKRHTIRKNADLWKRRFEKIERDEAYLSLRIWTGKPYRSKQKEILQLHKKDNIGIEIVQKTQDGWYFKVDHAYADTHMIAKNDGLSIKDFSAWFEDVDDEELALIYFTAMRYGCYDDF